MQRNETIARKVLEVIVNHDTDGTGLVRADVYREVERSLQRSSDLRDIKVTVDYHLYLLEDAGFVTCFEGESEEGDDGDDAFESDAFMLTWAGHDYFENK